MNLKELAELAELGRRKIDEDHAKNIVSYLGTPPSVEEIRELFLQLKKQIVELEVAYLQDCSVDELRNRFAGLQMICGIEFPLEINELRNQAMSE